MSHKKGQARRELGKKWREMGYNIGFGNLFVTFPPPPPPLCNVSAKAVTVIGPNLLYPTVRTSTDQRTAMAIQLKLRLDYVIVLLYQRFDKLVLILENSVE